MVLGSLAWTATALGDSSLPAIESASSDDRGRIMVNGKPFFPILMYDVPNDPDSLKMFRAHGFNSVTAHAEKAAGLREYGLYAAVHAGKKLESLDSVLLAIGMDSPALYWKDDLLGKARADLAKVREAVPGRPVMHAIGYWEDEPGGVISNKLPRPEVYEELVKAIDVSVPYLYPLPYQPVRTVGEAVARAEAASGGRKPLLPVLQLFIWDAKDPYPTPEQLRCMVYLSLIAGADGIGYYSYNYVTGKKGTNIAAEQPKLWESVKGINVALAEIGPFLLESEVDPSVTLVKGRPDVWFRAVTQKDKGLILMANSSDKPQDVVVRFTATQKGKLQRLGGGGDVEVQENGAKLTLAPFESVGLWR